MTKRIYVCTRSLAENKKNNDRRLPPVVVRVDNGPEQYAHRVECLGASVTRFDEKGAFGDGEGPHIWEQTEGPVYIFRDDLDKPIYIL